MALKKINRFLGRYAKGMQFFTSSPYITRISSKMVQVPPGWSKYVFQTFFFHVAEMLHSRETLIGRALINRGLIGPKSIFVLFQKCYNHRVDFPVFTSSSCGGGRLLFPGARSNKLSEGGGTNDSMATSFGVLSK